MVTADLDLTFSTLPDDLICPADEILDRGALRAALTTLIEQTPNGESVSRGDIVNLLKIALTDGRKVITDAFLQAPFKARATTRAISWLTDSVVIEVFHLATTHLYPILKQSDAERLSLIAVGGSGRGEMAPHSDVDLLFLAPQSLTPRAESAIEGMLYILWDLKLKVGHASRTVKECIKLAREDYTIRTALVEERFLDGDEELSTELTTRLRNDLFANTIPEFIEAKLNERSERHRKQGGQRYMVEPNVKEGKGGLRDLQSLYWIGKYVHGVKGARELVDHKVFTQDEYQEFNAAHEFLWAVRCHLHLLTGRASDQLTFDLQVEVAERMNYRDGRGRRAVEHFMQDYFRHATSVGELTRIFVVAQEQAHLKAEPVLQRLFSRKKKAKAPYAIEQNRLTVQDPDTFVKDPVNLLRIFEEALRTGTLLHSDAMRLVKANLHRIDEEVRSSKDAKRIFLDLLLKHGNPERALRRMNELGLLSAFIPEFGTIVAMMQFNMYHHYTVDEHTIQTISHLAKIERAELDDELPVSAAILKGGINRKVLYVALLLHDIGKGRDEDHSILGARIVRKVAPRLGLSKKDCETVEWLVRYHLLMSDMAQKRDVADPRTVRDFAKAVKTVERLNLLCVLTVCDIRGVGPDTWNNWKAVLIRALYSQTLNALENGMEALNRQERGSEARKTLRAALHDWPEKAVRKEVARHYPPYWQGLHVTAHKDIAHLMRDIEDDNVQIMLTPDEDRDATRVCFALVDHPGIFSRMCGALTLVGANVVDARTFTSKDGYAVATFWVQDAEGHPYDEARLPRLRQMIERTLRGELVARDALADRDKMKKRERAFNVATSITFDNDGSEIYTIIEVDTRDRPGLLHDLTRTLAEANVYISSAVIATYGEQVVDTFYVKDMFGLKYHNSSKQKALERKLRDAISKGSKRARA